jgi:2,4-dichlorophenol 6-monooxygenase
MRTMDTDVLVVGAGPTGLVASTIIATQGIPAITLARHPGTANQPRATVTNMRTIEVFRDLGIEDRVASIGNSLRFLKYNVQATSLAGMEIFRYTSYGTGRRLSDYLAASPCEPLHAPQHVLEPVILTAAVERGADIRFSHELVEIEQSPDEVRARVLDRTKGEEYLICANYAIGADGSRSRVAEQLGFRFEGESGLKHMLNMWIEADLADYVAHRPAALFQIAQPQNISWVGTGSFMCVRPWNEWMITRSYDPTLGEPDTSDAAVTRFAHKMIGSHRPEVRVKGTSRWQVNHMVATQYRRGRVFLAGDAAHRHPPAGGLGSNTSIQDAFNLAWKLAYVVSGRAGAGLLDSYEQERRPVGEQVVQRAMKALAGQMKSVEALGLRPGQSADEGWCMLDELWSDAPSAAERRAAHRAAVKLQDYRSNALGVELGQRYTSCAVVGDGTPFPEPESDPELYYHPTTHPGGYLPHAWVEHDGHQLSTLDLAGHGRFCVITGIGGEPWAQAAAKVGAELGIDLPVYFVGARCEYDDVLSDWASVREIDDRGALLVRPDRHVAWRSVDRPQSPEDALRAALRQVLALNMRSDDVSNAKANAVVTC